MFDRRLAQFFDWGLLGLTLSLGAIGLATVYSAVASDGSPSQNPLFIKQMIWFGVGLAAMIVTFLFNYKLLEQWAVPIYGACITMLICVLWFGKVISGSRR